MGKHFHIEADSGHDALLAILVHLNREDMGQAIDLLIDRLDLLSGDSDYEDSDEDRCAAHDDELAVPCVAMGGAHDHARDDDDTEPSGWSEWHTRSRRKLTPLGSEDGGRWCDYSSPGPEDDEDDDPAEANGDESDTGGAEDDELTHSAQLAAAHWHGGPGCYVSDVAEPSLAAPEESAGRWAQTGGTNDEEPWFVPLTLNAPMAGSDGVSA